MKVLWALPLLLLLMVGCQTPDPQTPGLASVVFRGNTPGQINRVADEVFARYGYKATRLTATSTWYERKGSLGSNILYGNWTGETGIWIRVKARLFPLEPGVFRMDCNAFRVRGRGEMLEEEIAFTKINKGHFQEILNECLAELSPKTNAPVGSGAK